MHPGLAGGLIGGLLGLIGGIFGTRAAIKNTSGARERAFVVKAVAIGWAVGLAFFALLILLPSPWRFALWVPYGIFLPLAVIKGNRALEKIRRKDAAGR